MQYVIQVLCSKSDLLDYSLHYFQVTRNYIRIRITCTAKCVNEDLLQCHGGGKQRSHTSLKITVAVGTDTHTLSFTVYAWVQSYKAKLKTSLKKFQSDHQCDLRNGGYKATSLTAHHCFCYLLKCRFGVGIYSALALLWVPHC